MTKVHGVNLSPVGRQETKKKIYLCTDKNGVTKTFKVNRLIDIPITWRKDPLFLGFTK